MDQLIEDAPIAIPKDSGWSKIRLLIAVASFGLLASAAWFVWLFTIFPWARHPPRGGLESETNFLSLLGIISVMAFDGVFIYLLSRYIFQKGVGLEVDEDGFGCWTSLLKFERTLWSEVDRIELSHGKGYVPSVYLPESMKFVSAHLVSAVRSRNIICRFNRLRGLGDLVIDCRNLGISNTELGSILNERLAKSGNDKARIL